MDWSLGVLIAIFGVTAVISGALVKGSLLKKIVLGVIWGICALVVVLGILFAGCLALITASK